MISDSVRICEMSPRDGLQFLGAADPPRLVPLELKIRLIEQLVAAGPAYIEVGAFVSPKVTPQMADTDALCRALGERGVLAAAAGGGIRMAALVPNLKHYERFRESRLDTVAVFVSASESYAQANTRASCSDLLKWARELSQAARAEGNAVRAHVSAAFQDVTAGGAATDPAFLVEIIRSLREAGCGDVALADTDGRTNPRRVRDVVEAVGRAVGSEGIGVHMHDRGGVGLANALAAFDSGVRLFDGSVGGLGGSIMAVKARAQSDEAKLAVPAKPGHAGASAKPQARRASAGVEAQATRASAGTEAQATRATEAGPEGPASAAAEPKCIAGNIATEEIVEMFESMRVRTGVDRGCLIEAGRTVLEITRRTGDFAPPGKLLRDQLGFGVIWAETGPT